MIMSPATAAATDATNMPTAYNTAVGARAARSSRAVSTQAVLKVELGERQPGEHAEQEASGDVDGQGARPDRQPVVALDQGVGEEPGRGTQPAPAATSTPTDTVLIRSP